MNIPIRQVWADPVEDHFVTLRPQPTLRQAIICLKAAVGAVREYHAGGSVPDSAADRLNEAEWSARADLLAAFEREAGVERELALHLAEVL